MPTDFGRDTSCATALRTGRLSTGRQLLAEAAYRRITTPRGMLRGGEQETNYGIDITSFVGTSEPRKLAASLPVIVRAELLKDERFIDVDVNLSVTEEGPVTEFDLSIVLTDTDGPFTFKVGVDEVSARFLGIEAQS